MVTEAPKVGLANGWTRAFSSADRMHAAAGVPSAAPLTATLCTRPSDPKTIVALDGRFCPLTHDRAAPMTEPRAAWTAPVDGFCGRPIRLSAGLSSGSAGALAWGFPGNAGSAGSDALFSRAASGSGRVGLGGDGRSAVE